MEWRFKLASALAYIALKELDDEFDLLTKKIPQQASNLRHEVPRKCVLRSALHPAVYPTVICLLPMLC